MEILLLIIGLVAGGVIGYLVMRSRIPAELSDLNTQKSVAEQRARDLFDQKEKLEAGHKEQEEEIRVLTAEFSASKNELENAREKLNEQKKDVAEMQERMKIEFRNLANDLLEEKSKKFTEQNKVNIDEILKPLQERIKDFEKKVEDTHKESLQKSASLKQQIEDLEKLNRTIGDEAKNLTMALKGQSKVQGNWGERILENILEVSGLEKNREYFVQENYGNEDGKRFIPDVIIRMPEEKNLVIDSKVSIRAYEMYCSCDDAVEQQQALKDHISSVKNHVKGLSLKSYQQLHQLKSLDFVLMFIPIDGAYSLVAQSEPSLWSSAYEKNVLIVTPLSLLPALRTVSNIWRQENQNHYALQIAKQSGDLYDKFVSLMNDLEEVKRKLNMTSQAFDDSIRKLKGRDNLVRKVERLRELGASASKQLPQKLLDWADD